MIKKEYYGLRHDVWGLGVFTFFLFSGTFPFEGVSPGDTCDKVLNSEPDWSCFKERKIDNSIIKLIKGMLIKDPNKRLTIREIMKYHLFNDKKKADEVMFLLKFLNLKYI
jgi:serine/threonine protein kinase